MLPELSAMLDFDWALRPTGIYFLLYHGQVQYVGKSINVPLRIAQHRNSLRRHLRGLPPRMNDDAVVVKFDAVRVFLASKDRLDALEIQWIQRLNPPCNTQLNRAVKFELKKHDFYRDLVSLGTLREAAEKQMVRLRQVPSLVPYRRPTTQRVRLLTGRSSMHV